LTRGDSSRDASREKQTLKPIKNNNEQQFVTQIHFIKKNGKVEKEKKVTSQLIFRCCVGRYLCRLGNVLE